MYCFCFNFCYWLIEPLAIRERLIRLVGQRGLQILRHDSFLRLALRYTPGTGKLSKINKAHTAKNTIFENWKKSLLLEGYGVCIRSFFIPFIIFFFLLTP